MPKENKFQSTIKTLCETIKTMIDIIVLNKKKIEKLEKEKETAIFMLYAKNVLNNR